MSRENNGLAKGLFIGFLVGGIAGAVTALLYAPKSGKELRGDIKRKTDELKDGVSEYLHATGTRTTEMINRGKHRSEEMVASAREKAEHIMDDAEKVLTDIRSRASAEQGKVKSAVRAGIDAYKAEKADKDRGA
jgi:gas vesicle protein